MKARSKFPPWKPFRSAALSGKRSRVIASSSRLGAGRRRRRRRQRRRRCRRRQVPPGSPPPTCRLLLAPLSCSPDLAPAMPDAEGELVQLYIYDLSGGMARTFSPMLLGRTVSEHPAGPAGGAARLWRGLGVHPVQAPAGGRCMASLVHMPVAALLSRRAHQHTPAAADWLPVAPCRLKRSTTRALWWAAPSCILAAASTWPGRAPRRLAGPSRCAHRRRWQPCWPACRRRQRRQPRHKLPVTCMRPPGLFPREKGRTMPLGMGEGAGQAAKPLGLFTWGQLPCCLARRRWSWAARSCRRRCGRRCWLT